MMIITRKQHAESEPFAMPFGPALGIGAIVWLFWRTQILCAIQNGKTFIETHDAAVLLVLFPMLILTSAWLVYRIIMIRRAIREEEANENNKNHQSLEETPLTPLEASTPPEV
jgi:hypothetical protein